MDKRHLRKIKRRDRVARWLISAGGIGVILCVLIMLLLILGTELPLFRPASIRQVTSWPRPADQPQTILAAGTDDYRESAFAIDAAGRCRFVRVATGETLNTVPARPDVSASVLVTRISVQSGLCYTLLWSDGRTQLVRVTFTPDFDSGERRLQRRLLPVALFPALPVALHEAQIREQDDGAVLAALATDGTLRVLVQRGETEPSPAAAVTLRSGNSAAITAFVLNRDGTTLYAGTADGVLLEWDLRPAQPALVQQTIAFRDQRRITALGLVFGDVSLAVGDDRGGISTWSSVALYGPDSAKRLAQIHQLPAHHAALTGFSFTLHDKSVLSWDEQGQAVFDHMTSERRLASLRAPGSLRQAQFSARGDTLVTVGADDSVGIWEVRSPHPEISWRVLFGRVWYEGYNQPTVVWQSSAANDDAEAKLSFVPLLFGSLKGTFYALLFATPLALFGALYTSQFAQPDVRGLIKPTVEVMAAIPSVVIGFLAALWLAPRIEAAIVAVLAFAFTLPLAIGIFLLLWAPLRRWSLAKRVERGYEFVAAVPILLLAVLLAWLAAPLVETAFFHGDFRQWLYDEGGARFDQRNSIVIAFALGFAVIPILFTIAEDAFSNVPNSLKAASLALGASRWQTVWRVVLPCANPGVFAALIIGFGRAIGETMIVLMATGNTPILDWSPFNGMRTLSANLAVEIPEAPAGGTLYRVLFLSAVLLFLLTSVLNTAAELIRQHLRKKYRY